MTQLLPKPSEKTALPDLPDSEQSSKSPWKRRVLMGTGLTIAATGLTTWYFLSRPKPADLQLSGRIEGYQTDIGAKIGGRVNYIAVREGDQVRMGQVVARLNDDEIQAQLRGAQARITTAQQQEQQARLQIQVVDSQIQQAQLTLEQSEGEQSGRIFQAQSTVAAAEAQLKQAQAQLNLARVNRDRFAQLVRDGAVTKQQFDQVQTNYEAAQATVEANQKQVDAARGGLTQAQTSSLNPGIRNAQVSGLLQQRQQAYAQLKAAQAEVKNAQAATQQIQAQLGYLNVVSPINGVVTARSVEPGAVVGSGRTLLSVVNLNTVYLRGFIPEGSIGKVRVGQKATVFLDSDPNQPLPSRVAAIDPQASFTPENIYFRDDRVQQVFGVKLQIDNPSGFAKPGMPADATILTESR